MKDFRASEAIYLCDDCGSELKVLSAMQDQETLRWEVDLECRNCGPQGKDYLDDYLDPDQQQLL